MLGDLKTNSWIIHYTLLLRLCNAERMGLQRGLPQTRGCAPVQSVLLHAMAGLATGNITSVQAFGLKVHDKHRLHEAS
jgi:hypothetical protein